MTKVGLLSLSPSLELRTWGFKGGVVLSEFLQFKLRKFRNYDCAMTFKELLNFGRFQETQATPTLDQYYDEFNSHDRGWHGSKAKGYGGGSGAAISALTLLAFLFLLNVMQQSLQDNNSTVTTTATTIFLRDMEQPISLVSRIDENVNNAEDFTENPSQDKPEEDMSYIKTKSP